MGNIDMSAHALESAGAERALHAHRLLLRSGLGLANIFAWVLLFRYLLIQTGNATHALLGVGLFYVFAQLIAILLTPLSAAHLRRGVKRSMFAGTLVLAASYVVLGATFQGYFNSPAGWGIALFAFLTGAYRALYWIPYRLQKATRGTRGPNLGYEFLVALMPAFAGFALVSSSFAALRLLFGAAALVVLSLVPAGFVPDIHEGFSWHYSETFSQLFARRNRSFLWRALLEGLQGVTLFLIWPLAVFLIVGESYPLLGAILSASLLLVFFLRRPYRTLVARWNIQQSSAVHVSFAVSGWLFRLAAGSPFALIFADSYSHITAPPGSGFEAFSFEQSADNGSFVDEYTAMREIGLSLGRIAGCACLGVLALLLPLPVALAAAILVAACAAGASVLVARKIRGAY